MTRLRVLMAFLVMVVLIGLEFRYGPIVPSVIVGNSMSPTLFSGEVRLLDWVSPKKRGIQRGDVVVIMHEGESITKRVAGVPGDTIYEAWSRVTNEGILVSAETARRLSEAPFTKRKIIVRAETLTHDEYYVVGDNMRSCDSREFGPVHREEIVGFSRPLNIQTVVDVVSEFSAREG